MNPSRPEPSEAELDQLLASRVERTSPEFEQRWRELRTELSGSSRRSHLPGWRWLLWPGLVAAGVTAAVVALALLRPNPATDVPVVAYEELLALDSALAVAQPLLEPENREALLHLPATPSSRLP